jgi:hypothetical protein
MSERAQRCNLDLTTEWSTIADYHQLHSASSTYPYQDSTVTVSAYTRHNNHRHPVCPYYLFSHHPPTHISWPTYLRTLHAQSRTHSSRFHAPACLPASWPLLYTLHLQIFYLQPPCYAYTDMPSLSQDPLTASAGAKIPHACLLPFSLRAG